MNKFLEVLAIILATIYFFTGEYLISLICLTFGVLRVVSDIRDNLIKTEEQDK